ncbi:hypothetical protein V3C99_001675, partial [Haemonchus contortus]
WRSKLCPLACSRQVNLQLPLPIACILYSVRPLQARILLPRKSVSWKSSSLAFVAISGITPSLITRLFLSRPSQKLKW